jgi:hypothetical protein
MSDIETGSHHDVLTTLRENGLEEPMGDYVGHEDGVKQESSVNVAEGNVLFLVKAIYLRTIFAD